MSEFMGLVDAYDNNDGTWRVLVPIRNYPDKLTLTIDNCSSEYDAKERSYLYMKQQIEQHNRKL